MISPCHSVSKGKNIRHRLSSAARSSSSVSCTTPSPKSHSKSLRTSGYHGTSADKQQRIEETVSSVTKGTYGRYACAKNSGMIKHTGDETVTGEHVVSRDSAAGNIHSQRLQSEDESQTYNYRHHRRRGQYVKSVDCHSSSVESSPVSARASVKSTTSGVETGLSREPMKRAQRQLCVASDITDPRHGSGLSSLLSPSYSECDTVEESQFRQQETASSAGSEIVDGEIQLQSAQDIQQQQESQEDLLPESSVYSEMSDEDCVRAAEKSTTVTEVSSESVTRVTVTADVHTRPPASLTHPPASLTHPPVSPTHPPASLTHPPASLTHSPVSPTHPPASPPHPPVSLTHPPASPPHPPASLTHPPVSLTNPPASPTHPPASLTHPPASPTHPPASLTHLPVSPTHPPVSLTHPPASPPLYSSDEEDEVCSRSSQVEEESTEEVEEVNSLIT